MAIQRNWRILKARENHLKEIVTPKDKGFTRRLQTVMKLTKRDKSLFLEPGSIRIDQKRGFVKDREIEKDYLYTGEVDEKGLPEGKGILVANDGAFHHGSFHEGLPDKIGIKALSRGKIFYGVWNEGKLEGVAKMISQEEESYRG